MTDLPGEIARATLANGGATVDVAAGRLLPPDDRWYFPRHPARTRIVPPQCLQDSVATFITDHRQHFHDGLYLGTWLNPHTTTCYLDLITATPDKHEALALARRYSHQSGRKIVAICNPLRALTEHVWPDIRR